MVRYFGTIAASARRRAAGVALSPPMDWRTYRPTDLPGVAALFAAALEFDRPTPEYVRYLVEDDPDFDPGLIWLAAESGQIAGCIVASLPDDRRQCPGGIRLFAVAAAYRRQGVAHRLFDTAEEGIRARGVSECVAVNCGHHRLTLGLDVRHTAAICLLLERGYVQTGTTQDMEVDLAGPDAPDLSTRAAEAHLRE